MRTLGGFANMGRKLPAGTWPLLVLAILICLALFSPHARADDTPEIISESVVIVDGRVMKNGLVVGNADAAIAVSIAPTGLISAGGGAVVFGDASLVGEKLMIGEYTPQIGNGEMAARFLRRESEDAKLYFDEVVVYRGDGNLDLGAIASGENAATYPGGIYVGEDFADQADALNTRILATSDDGQQNHHSTIWVMGDVRLADGGVITLAGHNSGGGGIVGRQYGDDDSFRYAFTMSEGGVLDMTTDYGASILMKDIVVTGGDAALRASALAGDDWTSGPALVGGSVAISGGSVTLGDYGMVRTMWDEGGAKASAVRITGGSVNLNGSLGREAVLQASADADRAAGNHKESSLVIDGADARISVAEGGHGVILSRDTDFRNGRIEVDGVLTVAGAAASERTVMEGIASAAEKWGNFHFGGGVMAIGGGGIVDFTAGDMTVTASKGAIDGTVFVTDGAVGNDAGVYTTNLAVARDGVFTVGGLQLNATDSAQANGVGIDGALVVKDKVAADENVAAGMLDIRSGGALTANAPDFVAFSFDGENDDPVGFDVSGEMVVALAGSRGALNLNAQNPEQAYNISSATYDAVKEALGLEDGELNLLGVVVDDKLQLAADENGRVNTAVTNPSALVTIDAGGGETVDFRKDVSVKEFTLTNAENVESVVLRKNGTFTGTGAADAAVIGGAPGATLFAEGDLTLGIAGNASSQGGTLGDVVFAGDSRVQQKLAVNDGAFRTGTIAATDDLDANVVISVAQSEGGQTTSLTAEAIDLSMVDADRSASVSVSNALLDVDGTISLNDNAGSGLTLANGAVVNAGSVAGASSIVIGDGSALNVIGNFELGENGYVQIGDKENRGELIVESMKLNGGTLFADPVWRNGLNSIYDATFIGVDSFPSDTVDGKIVIGQNSLFSYGNTDSNWLIPRVLEVGTWGPSGSFSITAATGLFKPLVIGNGSSFILDGSMTEDDIDGYTPPSDYARFAENSLLVVNVAAIDDDKAALTAASGEATIDIEEGAKLYLYNAQSDKTFKLLEGFEYFDGDGVIGKTAWNDSANMNDSAMTQVIIEKGSGSAYMATVTALNASEVYHKSSSGAARILNEIYGFNRPGTAINDVDSDNAGVRFISRATSTLFNGSDLDRQMATVEGAAQLAAVGGAPLHTLNLMRLASDTIRKRHSFSAGLIPHPYGNGGPNLTKMAEPAEPEGAWGSFVDMSKYNVDGKKLMSVWAAPVYQHSNISGMKIGAFDNKLKTNMGGANIGLDFDLGGNIRFGLVGAVGGGKAKTKGSIFAHTENSLDYFGLNAYAAWSTCNWSFLVDGGYTRVRNKLRQDNWLGGVQNRANAKVGGWDIGATVEYLVVAKYADIVPHAGLRYEGLGTNSYTVRSREGEMFNVGSDTQHLLTIPVGIAVSKDFDAACDFRVTPYADAGALFSVGDRSYKTRVAVPDLTSQAFMSRVIDAASFNASAGVNAARGRFFGGVNYNIIASKKQTAQSVWANVGVNF